MKDLLYVVLELDEWSKDETCDFCPNFNKRNKAVCQIRTRNKVSNRIVDNACACEECKEKFENSELAKCEKCGELKTRMSFHYNCLENGEKELPVLPSEERASTRYEKQINSLQEKLKDTEWTIQEEREAHEDFMEKSEEWGKRQKQELLEEIKRLRERVKQLEEQNNQSIAQVEVKETKTWPWKTKK